MKKQLLFLFAALLPLLAGAQTSIEIGEPNIFNEVEKPIPGYVPAGSVEAHKSAEDWSTFFNIQAVSSSDIASGDCGSFTWKLTAEYELIFEGQGPMPGCQPSQGYAPWYEYRESIQTITIPEGMTRIGDYAFYGCSNLTNITIPDNSQLNYISHFAFYGCSSLTNIIIPKGVTSIESKAFYGCSSLTYINIPESVTRIDTEAFAYCSSLTSITIPESVTDIAYGAFYNCSSLTAITCNAKTPPALGGLKTFYNVDKTIPVYVPVNSEAYRTAQNWSDFTNIQPIIIIAGTCSGNLTWKLIEGYELIIDGMGAMPDYDSAESVPWYGYRESIQTITLAEGVTSIGDYAFSGCSSLRNIYCYAKTVPETGEAVFKESNIGNATLHVPASALNDYMTTAPWNEFAKTISIFKGTSGNCGIDLTWRLTERYELIIEGMGAMSNYDSAESVPWYGYRESIQTITLPDEMITIGRYAFEGCSSLTNITMPDILYLKTIENCTFRYCSSLTAITIPEGVMRIGFEAFNGCSSLTAITCKAKTPPTIDLSTFNNVDKTIPVYVPASSVEAYQTAQNWSDFTNIQPIIIDSGTCGDNLTWKLNERYELIIEGTGAMPDYASAGSAPWYEYRESIQTITLPEGVTSIGDYAFSGCSSLQNMYCYAKTVPETGEAVFKESNIDNATLHVPASVLNNYMTTAPWNEFAKTIPSFKDAYGTCGSGNRLTWRLTEGYELIIEGTGSMSSSAPWYEYREYIQAITLSEGVKNIGNSAFKDCSSLTSISIPASVTKIEGNAFYGCSSLTNITLPEGVTSIGHHAFYGCSSLTNITLPEGVTSIGYSAFYGCSSLTNIIIPDGMTSIENNAFYGCSSLTNIIIPDGVTSIGNNAFYGCSSLTNVYCFAAEAPTAQATTFKNSNIVNATLHVPASALETYKTTDPWSSFGKIEELKITITLNWSTATLFEGEDLTLTATVTPDDAAGISISWSSSNPSVATVDNTGKVTAVAAGTAIITATANDGSGVSASCVVTVEKKVVAVSKISLSQAAATLIEGEDLTLTATVTPDEATDKSISWSSSNPSVATVDNTGKVTAVVAGTAIITAIANDGSGVSASCVVTVEKMVVAVSKISLSQTAATLIEGEDLTLTAMVTPDDAADKLISWSSSNPSVATVDNTGKVTAVAAGTAIITATANDGSGVSASCEVTVTKPTYVIITINQYGSGTYCSPYALDFSEVEGLKAYVAAGYDSETGVVTILRVMTANAGVGLFVKGEPGDYVVPVLESTSYNALNMLVGTLEATTVNSTDGSYTNYKYTIREGDAEPMFYPFVDGSTQGAGRAYLQIPTAWLTTATARSISYRFDNGEATDIDNAEIGDHESEIVYDLMGRRVSQPHKGGVYIVNGKKTIIK